MIHGFIALETKALTMELWGHNEDCILTHRDVPRDVLRNEF